MILNLFIKDFGIIEKTDLIFCRGLNVLTGETGSGKSMIIEAIQVVTGGRAHTDYIRAGCDRAVVQAAVDIRGLPGVERLLADGGITAEPDGSIILTREINKGGRNICRINGQMVPLGLFREAGRMLVDIQGQSEQQLLFDQERQLFLLDAYGGEEISGVAAEVAGLYRRQREVGTDLTALRENYREWARRQDLINYQINDIDGVAPKIGEDEELAAGKKRLANAERLSRLVSECYRDLYGGGEQTFSAQELAGKALKGLDQAVELDGGLAGARDLLRGALYQLEEACRELSAYADGLEFNPARLELIEERLDLLSRLKKKYGPTIGDVLSYRDQIAAGLGEMADVEGKAVRLEKELAGLLERLGEKAAVLSGLRSAAAQALEEAIARELADLEMGSVAFSINFSRRERISEKGLERAEYFISTNPGEPIRPLARIASGGETSRVMLAVKHILADMEGIPTLVFDEIDTGIGGRTIRAVALKLYLLGRKRQVLCVTHSPVVASVSQCHLLISKFESEGRTLSEVSALDGESRLRELARMLGGAGRDDAALTHARQLLEDARQLTGG